MKRFWLACLVVIDLKSAIRTPQSAIFVGALLFVLCIYAQAQSKKPVRIGYVGSTAATSAVDMKAFRLKHSCLV